MVGGCVYVFVWLRFGLFGGLILLFGGLGAFVVGFVLRASCLFMFCFLIFVCHCVVVGWFGIVFL